MEEEYIVFEIEGAELIVSRPEPDIYDISSVPTRLKDRVDVLEKAIEAFEKKFGKN